MMWFSEPSFPIIRALLQHAGSLLGYGEAVCQGTMLPYMNSDVAICLSNPPSPM